MTSSSSNTAQVIAITGKGGVGKSTVAAMIISCLQNIASGAILALDADPDANLARLLGIDVESTIGDLREDLLKAVKDFPPGMSKENYVEAGLHQIIAETPKVDLISMGRGEGPGCYCFINNLLRKFSDDLMDSYQWIVMDNEAGIEHLSRRTASKIDHLIVVVNDNPLSIDCAERIDELLADLDRDVTNKYFLINAARPDRVDALMEKMAPLSLEFLGSVPRDEILEKAIYDGESVSSLTDTPAINMINKIMKKMGAE